MSASSPIPVTLLPSPTSHLVTIHVVFRSGSADDPPGREGQAMLSAATALQGGSGKLTFPQLLDALYPLAGSIGVRVEKEITAVRGTVHRDHLEAFYGLFRQAVLAPRFEESDFERLRQDQWNALVNGLRATDDEELGKEVLQSAIYAGHPFGHPDVGTARGIRAIDLEGTKRFRELHFTRERCRLGIAGGFPEAFAETVVRDLADLPSAPEEPPALPEPGAPDGIELLLVTKPAQASAISIGFPLRVTRRDDDFYRLFLANSYLGEHRTFNGRLMMKMRMERGLNYGDYSYAEHFVQDGASTFPLPHAPRRQQYFSIWIRPVEHRNAHFAIRQALRELHLLVERGLTPAELDSTREFLLHYGRLWTQTLSRRLGYAMDGAFYATGSLGDEIARRFPSMTVEEVNAAVRSHLDPRRARVVVVTDDETASSLARALLANRPSPIVYDTETRPDVLEEDREIAAFPLPVDPARVRIVPATELFEE